MHRTNDKIYSIAYLGVLMIGKNRPWAHQSSYTVGTGSFEGIKRPLRGVDHPSPFSVEVKGRVELCSPSGSSWPVLG
jgi:hypothetical protein